MHLLFSLAWSEQGTSRHNPVWNFFFVKSTNSCKPVTSTRSITFELPLKGILNIYMNIPVFLHEMFSIRGQISWETFAVF